MGDYMKIDFKITEILTLPNKIMAALCLASGILLFSPTWLLVKLFMFEFREKHGFIIGIVFVLFISILTINLIYRISKSISEANAKKNFLAHAEGRLKKLNNYQKAMIYTLFIQDNHTFPLPLHDGAVTELEYNHFIRLATTQYEVSDLNNAAFPYCLQPWVSDELNSKLDLLSDFQNAFEQQYEKEMNQGNVDFW